MTVMVICYSNTLDLKFLLEAKGKFSEARINRDLNILSKGKILTLNETQKKFIQTVAQPENIEKKIVQIEGKVGSGKTLLGTEIVKMKLAHYIRKYNLRVDEMQQKIKVIILADDFNANVLVQQLKEDLFKDIGQYCDIEISSKAIREGVLETFIEENSQFLHTILMIDECYYDKKSEYNFAFQPNTDYIYCIRYSQVGIESKFNSVDVFVDETMVHCDLTLCQRSSQEILELANYLQIHSPDTFPISIAQTRQAFSGLRPIWIEIDEPEDMGNVFEIQALRDVDVVKDVMLIRDGSDLKIENFCQMIGWKCCHVSEVTGCEASVVVIYNLDQFRYETFTRAKNVLVIVTLAKMRRSCSSFTNALISIGRGIHETEHCNAYFKRLSKKSSVHSITDSIIESTSCPYISDFQISSLLQKEKVDDKSDDRKRSAPKDG